MKLINLTPHPINLIDQDGKEIVIESSGVARLAETTQPVGTTEFDQCTVSMYSNSFGDTVGLPRQTEETVYIVSIMVAMANPNRIDVVYPYPLVRDDKGKIIGCNGLAWWRE